MNQRLINLLQQNMAKKVGEKRGRGSDFHEVTTIILRKTIPNGNPKTILYRDYKSFYQNKFNKEVNSKMKKNKNLRLFNIARNSFKRSESFNAYKKENITIQPQYFHK